MTKRKAEEPTKINLTGRFKLNNSKATVEYIGIDLDIDTLFKRHSSCIKDIVGTIETQQMTLDKDSELYRRLELEITTLMGIEANYDKEKKDTLEKTGKQIIDLLENLILLPDNSEVERDNYEYFESEIALVHNLYEQYSSDPENYSLGADKQLSRKIKIINTELCRYNISQNLETKSTSPLYCDEKPLMDCKILNPNAIWIKNDTRRIDFL